MEVDEERKRNDTEVAPLSIYTQVFEPSHHQIIFNSKCLRSALPLAAAPTSDPKLQSEYPL